MRSVISAIAWVTGIAGLLIFGTLMVFNACVASPVKISSRSRFLLRIVLACFFVRVRVTGLEKIAPDERHVFMANHASFFDFFILGAYLPGLTRGMEAAEHFSWPFWGIFLRRSGMIPIERSSAAASMRSLKAAAAKVKDGASILVLPEGTRTRDGRMQKFNRLPFTIPKDAGCDIVPVGLKGMFRLKNKLSWMLRPGPVEMHFGEPIDAETIRETIAAGGLKALAALTRERVAALCGENNSEQ